MKTREEAAAAAIKAGGDICCGGEFDALMGAVQQGLISEKEIDGALRYALRTRFVLGLFDPPDKVPFSSLTIRDNDTPEHEALALKAARESIVLLKNDGLLPLDRAKVKRIAVIGANADSVPVLVGNYNGTPARPVTILAGIKKAVGTNIEILFDGGCPLATEKGDANSNETNLFANAVTAAKWADVVVYVGGINSDLEGEESPLSLDGFSGGDRTRIELPGIQERLIQALQAVGKPVIFVNCSGSAIAMPWEAQNLRAIVQAWYPGEQGGRAVADVLFGEANPSGRLPVTFYRATEDLPQFEDYSMSNRTYRYFKGKPLFAFGHGLSYTKFDYSGAKLNEKRLKTNAAIDLKFAVKNSGKWDGDEVAEVYFRHVKSAVPQPELALCGFTRVHLKSGERAEATVSVPVERLRYWDTESKRYVVEPGEYELLIGSASDDIRLRTSFKIEK